MTVIIPAADTMQTRSTFPNYIRTLLLNESRTAYTPDIAGEQYVAPYFYPRVLTPAIAKVHTLLLGDATTHVMQNYRMHQLMQILHSTELAEYMTFHDPRITYLPLIWPEQYTLAATDIPIATTADILVALQAALSYDDENAIFGTGLVIPEPYKTFKNLWRNHDFYAYKLGGLLLAAAFRTAALPEA